MTSNIVTTSTTVPSSKNNITAMDRDHTSTHAEPEQMPSDTVTNSSKEGAVTESDPEKDGGESSTFCTEILWVLRHHKRDLLLRALDCIGSDYHLYCTANDHRCPWWCRSLHMGCQWLLFDHVSRTLSSPPTNRGSIFLLTDKTKDCFSTFIWADSKYLRSSMAYDLCYCDLYPGQRSLRWCQ
jgi:hypothetical protein